MTSKENLSTFERIMKDKKRKARFEEGYKVFLLSELIIALMENDHKSVRQLAREVGLSPTVIQSLRSGQKKDLMTRNFLNIIDKLGYELELKEKKGPHKIVLSMENNDIVARSEDVLAATA